MRENSYDQILVKYSARIINIQTCNFSRTISIRSLIISNFASAFNRTLLILYANIYPSDSRSTRLIKKEYPRLVAWTDDFSSHNNGDHECPIYLRLANGKATHITHAASRWIVRGTASPTAKNTLRETRGRIRETVVVEEMSTMQQGTGEKRKEKWNRRSVDEIGASRDSGLSG